VTVFDAQTGKVLATINVGGVLEEAVEDAAAEVTLLAQRR
jgi:hypothetical protein